jgi:hypothetical protein
MDVDEKAKYIHTITSISRLCYTVRVLSRSLKKLLLQQDIIGKLCTVPPDNLDLYQDSRCIRILSNRSAMQESGKGAVRWSPCFPFLMPFLSLPSPLTAPLRRKL